MSFATDAHEFEYVFKKYIRQWKNTVSNMPINNISFVFLTDPSLLKTKHAYKYQKFMTI